MAVKKLPKDCAEAVLRSFDFPESSKPRRWGNQTFFKHGCESVLFRYSFGSCPWSFSYRNHSTGEYRESANVATERLVKTIEEFRN